MNQQIFHFLRKYSTDETIINKLLVTAFITNNKIQTNNKLLKQLVIPSDSEEYLSVNNFLSNFHKAEHSSKFTFEALVEMFEFVISPSDKIVNGAIYTSEHIREYITSEAFENSKNNEIIDIKIADISCGCGGFLLNASKQLHKKTGKSFKMIYKENIFGVDIQAYSINRTKILLSLYAIEQGEDENEFEFNLYVGDSLSFNWRIINKQIQLNNGFDMILGNPPYVCSRNMDETTKKLLENLPICASGHPDLYIPFFQIGYELLASNGILGFITVNNFIRSINGRALRNYFSMNKINLKMIDFEGEQVFKARSTYTCITFLNKKQSNKILYTIGKSKFLTGSMPYKIFNYNDLNNMNGWALKDSRFISICESIGKQFDTIYRTRSGIATLRNNVYIFKPMFEDDLFFYLDENIPIEKSICKDIVNSNLLVNERTLDVIKEKIIFPYFYGNDIYPKPIDENNFKTNYPKAYAYLLKNKNELAQREKGKGANYSVWYAFGRNQSLEKIKYKLFFPQLARENFCSCLSDDENLYFYNGMVAYSDNVQDLKILQLIFKSDIFWRYVTNVSKNYNSNFYSLGKNYIKNFGIPILDASSTNKLCSLKNKNDIDLYLRNYYTFDLLD